MKREIDMEECLKLGVDYMLARKINSCAELWFMAKKEVSDVNPAQSTVTNSDT